MTRAYVVRYGRMRFLGAFSGLLDREHFRGQTVVIRGDRGVELGEILAPVNERTEQFLRNAERGEILREAEPADLEEMSNLTRSQSEAFATCQELIARRRLQMSLVDVEWILSRERIVFYYLAEQRVDFRELVKDLAKVFRTRIEMRQIGVRDEAKLLADYGDCGKPVCCNTHLTEMPSVSMKMAKLQKTTLDPAKISGRCGRLKCCLRYEYETYRELERLLPPVGSRVETPKGVGRVVSHEILVLKVIVEFDDRRRIAIDNDDVEVVAYPRGRKPRAAIDEPDPSSSSSEPDSSYEIESLPDPEPDSNSQEHNAGWNADELS